MEVLIKKDVIEMNNVGLEYIRNHYKKYTALYIDENIEAYLRIITSDNFSYEEALHILGMEIGDKEKSRFTWINNRTYIGSWKRLFEFSY